MSGNFSRLFYIFKVLYTVYIYTFPPLFARFSKKSFQSTHIFPIFFQSILPLLIYCTKFSTKL